MNDPSTGTAAEIDYERQLREMNEALLVSSVRQHELTEQAEQAAAALRESEARWRLLIQNIKDYAIFTLDPQGNVTSWNEGAESTLGYQSEEITGQHFSRFFTVEDIQAGKPEGELRKAENEGRAEDDNWMIRKDGSRIWVNGVTSLRQDEAGRDGGFIKVARDITERRRLERETHEQAEALAELHQRKDEFLAMLSHELRNPLSAIRGALHLLRLQKQEHPLQERALIIMERQVGQLAHLVDDLLEVSRVITGRIQLHQERLDLRGIVEHAIGSVRPLIDRRQHNLSVSLPSEPIWIHADPTRLEQVVVNLLNNAAKYTNVGGQIWLTIKQESDEVVLRVRDTGVGIAPELLPRIFDLFTQASRTLDRSQGGLGIGLSLVQRLVELHLGTVEAHSAGAEQGSEFTVRLPLLRDESRRVRDEINLSDSSFIPHPSSLKMLVVDDNVDAADTVAMMLQMSGHGVRAAYSAQSALETAAEYQPDFVLLDIGLPEMDGYEVARRLRRQAQTKGVWLIAMTGYGRDSDRRRSQEAGFDHHLVKPVDPQKLEELLTTLAQQLRP